MRTPAGSRGQQQARFQFALPPATHPLGDQRAFIFSHGSPDLQQQLIMRVLAHGTVQKLHSAAMLFQFFQHQHLMNIIARQPVRCRD
jgi:hypothetical protein